MNDSHQPRTLLDKIWDEHIVCQDDSGQCLLYIDLHLVHEVTSPQAFEGLRLAGRRVRRPERTIAVQDHNVPTTNRSRPIEDPIARKQIETLRRNCREFGIRLYDIDDPQQGIVHVIGPEFGLTQPGMTIVCGDSHTSTHGAFGALAFGVGTSEVEHVLATQTLWQRKPRSFLIQLDGQLPAGVSAKDVILYLIGQLGTDAGTGYCIEYAGEVIRSLPVEGRMTICNMTIEMGARSGLIAPDEKTFAWLRGRQFAPADFDAAVKRWQALAADPDASYDRTERFDLSHIAPQVTWGTNPGQVAPVTDCVPEPDAFDDPQRRESARRALQYMGLRGGEPISSIRVDRVFIGSCTNGRLADLREAAAVLKGYRVAEHVQAMVVPGSGSVKRQAEVEGLDKVFKAAGFEWREPGCSMCLAMNPDRLEPGQRCASTTNRNFEGRQGKGGRTHLVSPAMAAAAAVAGHFVDVRDWDYKQ